MTDMGDGAPAEAPTIRWVHGIVPAEDLPVPIPVSSPALLDAVAARVGADAVGWAAQVGAEAAAHIVDELPVFGGTEHQREILRRGTESATLSALLMFVTPQGVPPPLPDDAADTILEYVKQDVSLDQLLSGIRLGHAHMSSSFLEACDSLVEAPGRTAALREVSARLFEHIDRFSRMAAELFTTERERWLSSEATAQLRAVQELLAGQPADSSITSRVGYELGQCHIGLVIVARGDTPTADPARLHRIAREVLRRIGGESHLIVLVDSGCIWAWSGWAAHRTPPPTRVDGLSLPPGTTVSFGAHGCGLDGFRRTHEQALGGLRVRELSGRNGGTVYFEQEELAALVSKDLRGVRELVARALGPLAAASPLAADLRATLKAYLDHHGSPVAAATALHVARNTVSARVQRAAGLLGRDLSHDVLDVHVALELVERLGGPVLDECES